MSFPVTPLPGESASHPVAAGAQPTIDTHPRAASHGDLTAVVAGLDAVDLDDLVAAADLQRRFDTKYLVPVTTLPRLVAALASSFAVLEVDGSRRSAYRSVYFDTPQLRTYRDHVQRRRRRFKIRTRHYGDPAAAMLEVKHKGLRGQTIKDRWPHPGPNPDELGAKARELIAAAVDAAYGLPAPDDLEVAARTRFHRITLADLDAVERVTIDLGLTVEAGGHHHLLGAAHAIVETKTAARRGAGTRALSDLGLRPARISKYGVGLTVAHDELRGTPWRPVLRTLTAPPGDDGAVGLRVPGTR